MVLAHEIGHTLGLTHSPAPRALMAPYYKRLGRDALLSWDDVLAVQRLYGEPRSRPGLDPRLLPQGPRPASLKPWLYSTDLSQVADSNITSVPPLISPQSPFPDPQVSPQPLAPATSDNLQRYPLPTAHLLPLTSGQRLRSASPAVKRVPAENRLPSRGCERAL